MGDLQEFVQASGDGATRMLLLMSTWYGCVRTFARTAKLWRPAGPRAEVDCLREMEPEAKADLRAERTPEGDRAARICTAHIHGDVCIEQWILGQTGQSAGIARMQH